MPDSLYSLYSALLARPADSIVGWRGDAIVSNEEFLQHIAAWHHLLQAQQGRNFALYLEDSIEFSAALLGAWHAGKTVWLTADTLVPSIEALRQSVDGFLGEFPSDCGPLQRDLAESVSIAEVNSLDPDFPALVVHTSGTTGAAQAVPKKLSQLASEVATLDVAFGAKVGDAHILATVSHQHIYGLLFRVLWPLTAGRAIHALSQNFPEELAQALALRPCVLIASPAHLKRLPDHLDWRGAQACARAIFSSGGPLPIEVAHATGKVLGSVPIEVYGSSETGGIAWRQRSATSDESWQALPSVEWRIADEDGLLEVRSPHLPNHEWLRIADRAEAQGGNRFMLTGRGDRIVKIEEKRISLDAIEALLMESPFVETVRIIVCDEVPGQRQQLAAFVALSEAGQQQLRDVGKLTLNRTLRALLLDKIEPVGYPRRWRYLDQMPVNAQGKTTRAMLLALLDERPREAQMRIVEQYENSIKMELTIPPDLFYFDGHFPEAPILPGVVQVDWAISYGRRYFDLPPQFRGVNALKFQHVIQPGQVVTLELNHDADKGSLGFRYVSAAGQHASGRVLFASADQQE